MRLCVLFHVACYGSAWLDMVPPKYDEVKPTAIPNGPTGLAKKKDNYRVKLP